MDRDSRGQHRDILRRQDRPRSGNRDGVPANHVRRARHAVRQDELRHGQHRRHRRSGRLGWIRRAANRRLSDASRRRRGPSRSPGVGIGSTGRAGCAARRHRQCRLGRVGPGEEGDLRRADRWQAVQRHVDGQQHQCDHRHGEAEGRPAVQDRRHSRRSATTSRPRSTARSNGRWTPRCLAWSTRATSSRRLLARSS